MSSISSSERDALAGVQLALADAVTRYAAAREAVPGLEPFGAPDAVTATEVAIAVSAMLRWADIGPFDLIMWEASRGL